LRIFDNTHVSDNFIKATPRILKNKSKKMNSFIKLFSSTILATSLVSFAFGQQTTARKQFCDSSKLRILVLNGRVDSVRMCLNQGADPNMPNEDGLTLLMIAAANGHDAIVKDLLNKSAKINVKTKKDSITALMFASAFLHHSTVKILVEQGHANIMSKDESGRRTALEWTSLGKSTSETLPEKKAQADSVSISIGKYLVSKGATYIKNPKEMSGIDLLMGFGVAPDLSKLLNKFKQNE
jgi:YD repeat-containing protein